MAASTWGAYRPPPPPAPRPYEPAAERFRGDARARQGWQHADGEAEADDGPLVVLETLERNVTRDRGDACCCAAAHNVVVLGTDHGAVLRYDFAEGGAYGAEPPRSTSHAAHPPRPPWSGADATLIRPAVPPHRRATPPARTQPSIHATHPLCRLPPPAEGSDAAGWGLHQQRWR